MQLLSAKHVADRMAYVSGPMVDNVTWVRDDSTKRWHYRFPAIRRELAPNDFGLSYSMIDMTYAVALADARRAILEVFA